MASLSEFRDWIPAIEHSIPEADGLNLPFLTLVTFIGLAHLIPDMKKTEEKRCPALL